MNITLNETINQTVQNAVNETMTNTSSTQLNFFGEMFQNYFGNTFLGLPVPFSGNLVLDIFLISLVATTFTTLINKYMIDQTKIKALKEEMKVLRKNQKKVLKKGNQKEMQEYQQKIMAKSMEQMKHSMQPKVLLTTMIPMLVLFGATGAAYNQFGEFLNLGFTQFGWFGSYFWLSVIGSMVIRKILNVA